MMLNNLIYTQRAAFVNCTFCTKQNDDDDDDDETISE